MDRKQQAKEVDIISLLSDFGYQPSKVGQTKVWYHSPLASENVASFVVRIQKNTWSDYGRGKGGDTIAFVMEHEGCTFSEAISLILDGNVKRPQHKAPKTPIKESSINIVDVKHLQNKYLIEYAKSRAIDYDILSSQCKEVDFVFSNWDYVTHTAIGFENDKGGWELRSASKKVGNSPKYWTTVRGNGDEDACDVFEGFFDFMSHLKYNNITHPVRDSIILNSLSFCSWVQPELEMYRTVALYFDNDKTADKYIKEFFTDTKYALCNDMYRDYPDYNEFLKSQIK